MTETEGQQIAAFLQAVGRNDLSAKLTRERLAAIRAIVECQELLALAASMMPTSANWEWPEFREAWAKLVGIEVDISTDALARHIWMILDKQGFNAP